MTLVEEKGLFGVKLSGRGLGANVSEAGINWRGEWMSFGIVVRGKLPG